MFGSVGASKETNDIDLDEFSSFNVLVLALFSLDERKNRNSVICTFQSKEKCMPRIVVHSFIENSIISFHPPEHIGRVYIFAFICLHCGTICFVHAS